MPLGKTTTRSSGSVLLCSAVTILVIASLAVGVTMLSPAASLAPVTDNRESRARYMALSGLNVWSDGRTGTFTVGPDAFTLTQSGPDANGIYTVSCSATVAGGTPFEANATVVAKRSSGAAPISSSANFDDFALPVVGKTTNAANAITVYSGNASTSQSNADSLQSRNTYTSGSMHLGNGEAYTTGAIWYQGSRGSCSGNSCPDGACQSGKCTFAKGLRAYFGFVFAKVDTDNNSIGFGDGFTFSVMNAASNDPATAAGGAANGRMAEYLGYAGPGPSGFGISAPKMAVEVDVYPDTGRNPPTMFDSRADASTANHIAVVYWGDAGSSDDNVHGAGSSPANPSGPTAEVGGYYETPKTANQPNWLEDGREHAMRLEIHREDAATGGTYRVRVWIDGTGSGVADVTSDYTGESPQLDYTTTLAAVDHAQLDAVYFGWTEGTGARPQDIIIHDFSLEFRR